jgi:hypothetical protein
MPILSGCLSGLGSSSFFNIMIYTSHSLMCVVEKKEYNAHSVIENLVQWVWTLEIA